jgi:hypothetical protein
MTCVLCRLDRELRNSHIVPEFLHKPIYDEKHRTLLFGYGDERAQLLQKGIRERLLCDDCEGRLQKYEDYFARRWYQKLPFTEPINQEAVALTRLDYPSLKLFLLSIVWRASVAQSSMFRAVDLGPHEDTVRTMLLKEEPRSADEYRIYAGLIIDPNSRQIWDQVILEPLKIRVAGQWAYRMVFGGVSWTVVISRHGHLPLEKHYLTERGELLLPCIGWPDFARAAKLPEAVRHLKT